MVGIRRQLQQQAAEFGLPSWDTSHCRNTADQTSISATQLPSGTVINNTIVAAAVMLL